MPANLLNLSPPPETAPLKSAGRRYHEFGNGLPALAVEMTPSPERTACRGIGSSRGVRVAAIAGAQIQLLRPLSD